jgi:hypothetical protein
MTLFFLKEKKRREERDRQEGSGEGGKNKENASLYAMEH